MKASAGLLLYRRLPHGLEVLLVHPGGPYVARRGGRVWSIPKGLVEPGEATLSAARREFTEETGLRPQGPFLPLGTVRYSTGKTVHAWAVEGDCDPTAIVSNTFAIEWPPRSGRTVHFPEVDRAAFFDLPAARRVILSAQEPFLDALLSVLETGAQD
ncbi:MAG: NUDIX domain-containing protein [Actinobacteria bacterium]|nr:NUDIX domain-containing protein [Actinomycetota bacterium]